MNQKKQNQENVELEYVKRRGNNNYTSIYTALFGIAAGSIITFFWNDLSQFLGAKLGFGVLGFFVIVSFFLVLALIRKYISSELNFSLEKFSNELPKVVENPRLIGSLILNLKNDVKPFLSLWTLSRVLSLVILIIATVLGGILAIQQNKLIDNQNKIVENQNTLFGIQNSYIAEELEKVKQQTELLRLQTELLDNQNSNIEKQTGLFKEQNYLVGVQNKYTQKQIEIGNAQNSLIEEQNSKLEIQNNRLNFQNNLLEAERRSSLIFLMSNVLDKVDEEIKVQEDEFIQKFGNLSDSVKFILSGPLIGRIVALSRSMQPYYVLEHDSLKYGQVSQERGHLFVSLMASRLESSIQQSIVSMGDFSYGVVGKLVLDFSNFERANFERTNFDGSSFKEANLKRINFKGASLRNTHFYNAKLTKANLEFTNLYQADFRKSRILWGNLSNSFGQTTDFSWATLKKTDISHSRFYHSDFSFVNLSQSIIEEGTFYDVNFEAANLIASNLYSSKFESSTFKGANFRNADLHNVQFINVDFDSVKELTYDQLTYVFKLYNCKNLPKELLDKLAKERPCIFKKEGCIDEQRDILIDYLYKKYNKPEGFPLKWTFD